MDSLAKKLNITSVEGWYGITSKTFHEHGGAGLLDKYNGSTSKLLTTLLPDYKQACVNFVMDIVNELKLKGVEDVIQLPKEYQTN